MPSDNAAGTMQPDQRIARQTTTRHHGACPVGKGMNGRAMREDVGMPPSAHPAAFPCRTFRCRLQSHPGIFAAKTDSELLQCRGNCAAKLASLSGEGIHHVPLPVSSLRLRGFAVLSPNFFASCEDSPGARHKGRGMFGKGIRKNSAAEHSPAVSGTRRPRHRCGGMVWTWLRLRRAVPLRIIGLHGYGSEHNQTQAPHSAPLELAGNWEAYGYKHGGPPGLPVTASDLAEWHCSKLGRADSCRRDACATLATRRGRLP
jgi:hypothetical protein